jgi:hypothetical protein
VNGTHAAAKAKATRIPVLSSRENGGDMARPHCRRAVGFYGKQRVERNIGHAPTKPGKFRFQIVATRLLLKQLHIFDLQRLNNKK